MRVTGTQQPARAGFGLFVPGVPSDLSQLNKLTTQLGRRPSTVMWYQQWAGAASFPAGAASNVVAIGATPEITWEPWAAGKGVNQPAYSLAAIASGRYDSYIRTWATQIMAWGHPIRLRFAHEMNGNWYPWAEGVNGNQAGSYIEAWRHVHSIFASVGVSNVIWVWSPNAVYPGTRPLPGLYPGDAYVDETALDGYNWSTLGKGTQWVSFQHIFGPSITQVKSITSKPLAIGEVGCAPVGGNKAAWITAMFATVAATPAITGFTWFNQNKEADWRIESSAASLTSFKQGLIGYTS
jgi:beta-mannanase